MRQAFAVRQAVQAGIGLARAPLLPQLSAGIAWSRVQNDAGDLGVPSRTHGRNPSITLNQTLLDLGRVAALRSSEAQAASQDASYQAAEQALPVRVATAYFNVLVAAETLGYVQANEDAFAVQVRNAESRYKAGLSALVDLNQARAYHASARSNTISVRNALATAREALTLITGVPTGELKTLRNDAPTTPPEPADPAVWVALAMQRSPTLQAQRDNLAATEHGIDNARAGYLPTLGASVSVRAPATWPSDGTGTEDGHRTTTFGVALNVPLFAGGAVQSQVRQTQALRDSAQEALELQRRQIVLDVQDEYRTVVADIEQIVAARDAVDAAQRALASTRVGQQSGTQTMTDLLLAIQLLASTQSAYSQIRHRFVIDKLLLLQSAGTISDMDLVAVNAQLQ